MQTVFTSLGVVLAVVFAVAVAVAVWEHYRMRSGRRQAWSELPPSDHAPLAEVDVDVENFATLPPVQGDSADRRAALQRTLGKLAQGSAAAGGATPRPAATPPPARPLSWVDTEPMVGPGPRADPVYPPTRAHNG